MTLKNTNWAFELKSIACIVASVLSISAHANSDLTSANPAAISASGENGTFEGRTKAFDNDKYSKWLTFSPSGWISYQFDQPERITNYTITSANDVPSRDPQDWQLQGSSDGVNWQTLDVRNNQSFSTRHETKQFIVSNPAAFKFVRLHVTANGGASILQVAEIEMFGSSIVPPPNELPISHSNTLNAGQWQHW